uniref:BTB domain-containing protein n=1 Tax=Rhizophagus irregularis (strain DAOM 181602 / DAOM 197198 / MUCL 43194) TaxID=747089 RepID=U9UIZ8_RHIID
MIPLPSDKKFIQEISQIRRKPSKRMIGHSFVLKVRSVYFHNKLHSMDENEEFDKFDRYQFKFPEYTFEIFDKILSFIYSNEINVSTMNSLPLLNLMKAAKRFQLTDMVEYLQAYLIENQSSWIYENIFTEAFDNEESQQLQSLVIDLICKNTKWFLNLDHFNKFSEEQLIKFLQIDDLSVEEFHVWNAVLGWAFVKNADLNEKHITQWSVQEIESFKKTLNPFIPFIRFFQMSILPEDLVNEISLMDVDEEFIVGSSSSTSSQKMVLNVKNVNGEQTDPFLFSFNKNNENNMGKISSYNVLNSVHNCHECGPCFGTTDLWITPNAAHLTKYTDFHHPLENSGYHRQGSYEIKLRNKQGIFQFKDYEVFQVIHV